MGYRVYINHLKESCDGASVVKAKRSGGVRAKGLVERRMVRVPERSGKYTYTFSLDNVAVLDVST